PRAGPRQKTAAAIEDRARRLRPVDVAILFVEDGRQRCLGVVLRLWLNRSRFDACERRQQQLRAASRQSLTQFDRVFLGADGSLLLQQHVTGIETGVDAHGGDAGDALAVRDGPLNGRGAAILRQQRRVHIDDAVLRQIDDRLRNDLPVAHYHHRVGVQLRQLLYYFGAPNSFRLVGLQAEPQRRFFHGGCGHFTAPALRPVRLRVDGEHFMSAGHQALERGHREGRRAHEDQTHCLPPLSRFLQLANLAFDEVALEHADARDIEAPEQMIDLVNEGAGQHSLADFFEALAFYVLRADGDLLRAGYVFPKTGQAEAPLFAVLNALPADDLGIDQHQLLGLFMTGGGIDHREALR